MTKNIIFPIEFNHLSGGMIHSVISLIKSFSKEYNIFILAHKDAEITQLGLDATPLFLNNQWFISLVAPLKTLKTYLEIRNLLKNFDKKDTLVFTNNVGSEMIFSGFGFIPIPLKRVFVSRGGDYTGKTGVILKKGFRSASKFIAISNAQQKKLADATNRMNDITLINNGLSLKIPENFHYSCEIPIKNITIVGFPSENKNQLLAIRALSIVLNFNNSIHLNLYGAATSPGDVIYQEKMIAEINRLGISESVTLKGYESDKTKIYTNTDVLISCALSEGFGRTVAEAMSFGIPSIGLVQSGGLLDIISDNHNGFLIKNDEHELANTILLLMNDQKLRQKISINAKQTYEEKFTEKTMIDRYLTFIRENF